MAETTIEWADYTHNAWIGCAKVSPACAHCYAAVDTFPRVQRSRGLELWGVNAFRHVTSEANWRKPLAWNRAAAAAGVRRRVFCSSLSDVFEDRDDLVAPRERLWRLIWRTPHLDWLLLTKRPECADRLARAAARDVGDGFGPDNDVWPSNVWLGTTCEDQEHADKRLSELLKVPAAGRFLSCEPLLGPIDLARATRRDDGYDVWLRADGSAIAWVIVGGESGPHARPFDPHWARAIRDECKAADVAFFCKQLGHRVLGEPPSFEVEGGGRAYSVNRWILDDGSEWAPGVIGERSLRRPENVVGWVPYDAHGGDMDEWPPDLRVREFPNALHETKEAGRG